jgi:hypothetical protein
MAHVILVKDEPKRSMDLAKIFDLNIWYFNKLPPDIVSDQDRHYHAFGAEIYDLLDIHSRMSMAYHL